RREHRGPGDSSDLIAAALPHTGVLVSLSPCLRVSLAPRQLGQQSAEWKVRRFGWGFQLHVDRRTRPHALHAANDYAIASLQSFNDLAFSVPLRFLDHAQSMDRLAQAD